jgi:hypothetical protein
MMPMMPMTMGLEDDTITEEIAMAMDLEETTTAAVVGQSMANLKNKKEVARSAGASTSTATTTASGIIGLAADAAVVGMDLEEIQQDWKARRDGSSSRKTEAAKTVGNSNMEGARSARTSTTTTTTTTIDMQKIDEGNEEEEEILGMKTRNRRKINLSFAIELNGQEGEDIRGTAYYNEGDNNNKMKHHPIMSKLAQFHCGSGKEM